MNVEQAQDIAGVGKSLSVVTRVLIVASLAKGPRAAWTLGDELKVAQPVMGYHLALLRMTGVVQRVRKGQEVHYSLNREKLEVVRRFLAGLK